MQNLVPLESKRTQSRRHWILIIVRMKRVVDSTVRLGWKKEWFVIEQNTPEFWFHSFSFLTLLDLFFIKKNGNEKWKIIPGIAWWVLKKEKRVSTFKPFNSGLRLSAFPVSFPNGNGFPIGIPLFFWKKIDFIYRIN